MCFPHLEPVTGQIAAEVRSPDGQSWPWTLSSWRSLPLPNRPLIVRQPGTQLMSKAPLCPGRIVPTKPAPHILRQVETGLACRWCCHSHCHFSPPHDLGIFPETGTKHDSGFAFDWCTLGLQMDREEEKGAPVFCHTRLGELGNSGLFTSFNSGWKTN